jgi:hypothetical protein
MTPDVEKAADSAKEPAGAPGNEVTEEMIYAGGDCLDEHLKPGGGLVSSPDYVAEQVYRAMEKRRVETREVAKGDC